MINPPVSEYKGVRFFSIQWGPTWQRDTLYIYLGIVEKSYIIIRELETMVLKYLARNSRLFKSDQSSSFSDILIYGEEVALVQPENESNGRMQVRFRDRPGWIMKEHLSKDPVLEIYFIDVGQGDSTFI